MFTMFGGVQCHCDIGIGASAVVVLRVFGGAAECVASDGTPRFTVEGSLERNARFLEEVSYKMLPLQTRSVTLGGSLIQARDLV